jgi:hypothetical protein
MSNQEVTGDIVNAVERATAFEFTPPAQREAFLATEIIVATLKHGPESLCGTEQERRDWVDKMRAADDDSWKAGLRAARAMLAIMRMG